MWAAYFLLCIIFAFMIMALQKDSKQKWAFGGKTFVICNI